MINTFIDEYIEMYNKNRMKVLEFKIECEKKIESLKLEEQVLMVQIELIIGI